MRLVHTADLHLDACYAASGLPPSLGNRLRQGMREVFHRIVMRAGDWPADALLIAGDLFESERVTRDTVQYVISEFQAIPHVPVFIVPGKSDPYTPDSPYATEVWPRNVTLFESSQWTPQVVRGGRLVVHGLGYNGEAVPKGAYRGFDVELSAGNGAHVALTYGWEKQPASKADPGVMQQLSYVGLGGRHSTKEIELTGVSAAYYSGAPQGHGFDGRGPHHFLEIQVLAGNAHVRAVPSSRMAFVSLEIDCSELKTPDEVVQAVRRKLASEALPLSIRLTLTGRCLNPIRGNLGAVQDALSGDVQFLEVVNRTESTENFAELAKEESSFGAFMRTINEELDDCTDDTRMELLARARETGMAAFCGGPCEITGLETV